VSAGVHVEGKSRSCCLYVAHSAFLLSLKGLSANCVQSDCNSRESRFDRIIILFVSFVASGKPFVVVTLMLFCTILLKICRHNFHLFATLQALSCLKRH